MDAQSLAARLKARPAEFVPPPPLCDQLDKLSDDFLSERDSDVAAREGQARFLWGGDNNG